MKKIFLTIFITTFLFLLVFFPLKQIFAQSAVSDCVVTKVGKPGAKPDLSKCIAQGGSASAYAEKIIEIAKTQIGKPYSQPLRCGPSAWQSFPPPTEGSGCKYFDCSSFAGWAYYWGTDKKFKMCGQTCCDFGDCYAKYNNYKYYSFNSSKYTKFSASQKDQLQPGDLLYFGRTTSLGLVISHVAIYEGALGNCGANDCMIESYDNVAEARLSSRNTFVGFLRPKIN